MSLFINQQCVAQPKNVNIQRILNGFPLNVTIYFTCMAESLGVTDMGNWSYPHPWWRRQNQVRFYTLHLSYFYFSYEHITVSTNIVLLYENVLKRTLVLTTSKWRDIDTCKFSMRRVTWNTATRGDVGNLKSKWG